MSTDYQDLYEKGKYQEILQQVDKDFNSGEDSYWQIVALDRLGRTNDALELGLSIYEKKINQMDKKWKIHFLRQIGRLYRINGDLDKSIEFTDRSYELAKNENNDEGIARSLIVNGRVYVDKGNMNKAIKLLNESLQIIKGKYDDLWVAGALNNLGEIYRYKGELDDALKYYKDTLKLAKNKQNNRWVGIAYHNLGLTYRKKGEIEKAIRYLLTSLPEFRKFGNQRYIAHSLMELIDTYSFQEDLEKSNEYLQKLEKISDSKDVKIINLCQDFAQGIILKVSKRSKTKVKAMDIFEQIIEYNDFQFELLLRSLSHLIELLIEEYRAYGEDVVLEEISTYTNRMYSIAQDQNIYSTLIDVMIFQSRLDIIRSNFERAETLLTQALVYAEEQNMSTYIDLVEMEREKMEKELLGIKNRIENSSITEKLEKAEINRYIKRIQKIS